MSKFDAAVEAARAFRKAHVLRTQEEAAQATRLGMRTPQDQQRFLNEAVAGNAYGYQFRIPGDWVDVTVPEGARTKSRGVDWSFGSTSTYNQLWSDANNALGAESPRLAEINAALSQRPLTNVEWNERAQLLRDLDARTSAAVGYENPRMFTSGRVDRLPDGETLRVIRRINAVLKGDAASAGPRSYNWTPTSDSREKLYEAMAKGIPGYNYSNRPDRGPILARQRGAPAPTGADVGQNTDVSNLPILAVPATAAVGAGALAMQPQEAQAATPDSALARAIARQAPRFNEALDTSLDIVSLADISGGYATETARALKDLPQQIQGSALNKGAGTLALAPLVGATKTLGSIGQLPELGVAGGRAIARAIARAPQPRGSATYRKKK